MIKNTLPTVAELAKALKERIDSYKGGYSGVWKQIDARLKDLDPKSIEGQKNRKNRRICLDTFKHGYYHLGDNKDSDKLEKMSFGIIGNPVLLTNIFEILGIKGYGDLLKAEFKRPDITDELVFINTAIEEVNVKMEELNDKIENAHPKSIKVAKLNTDFEEILKRLFSVITDNRDILMENQLYYWSKNGIDLAQVAKKLKEAQDNYNMREMIKYMSIYNLIDESNKFFYKVKNAFLEGAQPELRRVCLLLLIFNENKEYRFREKILLEYSKEIEKMKPFVDNFHESNAYILSPLYLLYFFLNIAILFIKRTGSKAINSDVEINGYVRKVSDCENVTEYLLQITKKLNREIKKIITYLIKNEIEKIPPPKYEDYKKIAIDIFSLFHTVFIIGKSDNCRDNMPDFNDFQFFTETNRYKYSYISGKYTISRDNINAFENNLNNIINLVQATWRDVNG